MKDFNTLDLPAPLLKALSAMQFSTPTPIQAAAIPMALAGKDILGSAQTGTGKTAAFAIPLLAHLIKSPKSMAVVMTPTRELAVQVMQAMRKMMDGSPNIRAAILIGGESMQKQFQQLNAKPRLIVGTPGRINDHLSRNSLKIEAADFLVLDEMDRMLDMGFGIQIDKILKFMTLPRQTLLFSATMPQEIIKLANKYTKSPERISVGSTTTPIDRIKQDVLRITPEEKYATLTQQLDQRTGSIIIFVKTKHGADRLAQKLTREKHSAEAIHGDLRQNRRDRVIRDFREKKHRILVATDVAARGLDIPHIEHVINYDLPQCPEDYIHRIGRTARAGAEGSAICLVTPEDGGKWNAIHRLMHPNEKPPMQERSAPRGNRNKAGGKPFSFNRKGGDSRSEGRPEGHNFEGKKRKGGHGRSDGQRKPDGQRRPEGKKFDGQRAKPDGQRRPDNRGGNSGRPQNGDRPRHRAA